MRILVVRFSSIGDIVLTTPVFRLLKARFPNAEIHWVTKTAFSTVLNGNPYIDHIWLWDDSVQRKELRIASFDLILDLQKNARSRQVKWMFFGTPNVSIPKENLRKLLWVLFKQHRLSKWPFLEKALTCKSFTDRCIGLLRHFGISDDGIGLDYFVDAETVSIVITKLKGLENFMCLSLGGSFFTKRLPLDKWTALIRKLGSDVVLIGGTADEWVAQQIEIQMLSEGHVFKTLNLVGKLSLQESAAVIKLSQRTYTGDTGMLHISAALGKQTHLFWGNTIPEFGMKPPIKEGSALIQYQESSLSCRPCSKLGFDACPKGHFNCMNNLQI